MKWKAVRTAFISFHSCHSVRTFSSYWSRMLTVYTDCLSVCMFRPQCKSCWGLSRTRLTTTTRLQLTLTLPLTTRLLTLLLLLLMMMMMMILMLTVAVMTAMTSLTARSLQEVSFCRWLQLLIKHSRTTSSVMTTIVPPSSSGLGRWTAFQASSVRAWLPVSADLWLPHRQRLRRRHLSEGRHLRRRPFDALVGRRRGCRSETHHQQRHCTGVLRRPGLV